MHTRIVLGEYETKRVRVDAPTAADLRLSEQLRTAELAPRITIRWLAGGEIDVTASSWVGVIHLSMVDIHVVPKLVGGPLRVLRMLEYAAGVQLLSRLPAGRPLPANGEDLFDLLGLLLAEETKSLVRDGLLRDYRPVDDSLDVLRGRLRLREQYLRRYGQLHRLECHFDEYDSNTPDNQLVTAALQVARRRVRDQDIRGAAMRLAAMMSQVCTPPTSDAAWYEQTIHYGRRNQRYRPVHELSKLILRGVAFDDLYDTSSGRVSAFMLDMNRIFERFVTRLVQESLTTSGLQAHRQAPQKAVIQDDDTRRPYSTIRPDLVVEDPATGRAVPIDIKYKLYADKKVAADDIYQLFLYAYVRAGPSTVRRAGLIYPTTSAVNGPSLSIRTAGGPVAAQILGAGLDVPAALDALAGAGREELHASVRATIERITGLGRAGGQSRLASDAAVVGRVNAP